MMDWSAQSCEFSEFTFS